MSVNYSSYTLDDLDHPILKKIYSIYWDISLFFTTIFFILMFYTIIKKSTKEMGGYKWYLCHQLFWSYAFEFLFGLWKPIPLWPFYIGYSAGIFSDVSSQYAMLPLVALTAISVGMGFSIFISALHRYVQASPLSLFFYDYVWLRYLFYIPIFIGIQCGFCLPIYYNVIDIKGYRTSLENQNPIFVTFFLREPSLFGHNAELNSKYTQLFMVFMILTLIILFLVIILLYFNYLRILYKNKSQLIVATFKLQKILFKSLFLQMILAICLLILPVVIALILTFFGLKWVSKFSILVFMITSTHAIVDFTIMAYFIRPYRLFIIGSFKKCLTKIGFNFKETHVIKLMAPSSTTATSSVPIIRQNY